MFILVKNSFSPVDLLCGHIFVQLALFYRCTQAQGLSGSIVISSWRYLIIYSFHCKLWSWECISMQREMKPKFSIRRKIRVCHRNNASSEVLVELGDIAVYRPSSGGWPLWRWCYSANKTTLRKFGKFNVFALNSV